MCEALERRTLLSFATTDYYFTPFGGHTWEFDGTENGAPSSGVMTSTAWVPESGVITTRYERKISVSIVLAETSSDYEAVTDLGVMRYRSDFDAEGSTLTVRFPGGMLVLPPSLTPGQVHTYSSTFTYEYEGNSGTGQISGHVTVYDLETVTTPAGEFSALKLTDSVSLSLEANGQTLVGTEFSTGWLAKGIGAVRESTTTHTESSDGTTDDSVSELSLTSFINAAPTVGSLDASAAAVFLGEPLTLTAGAVADADGIPRSVAFYLDSNDNGLADPSEHLGSDADLADGAVWALTPQQTAALPVGVVHVLAVASDNNGGTSAPRSVTVTVTRITADSFATRYAQAPKAADGLVDGDWIADSLKANVANVATSDAYWGARNHWYQDTAGNVWALWQGGAQHASQTLPGQHEWVLTNLTDAAGLSGSMHFAPGSLSGITTGWNAFNIQGVQDGRLAALWWSPEGSAGTWVDTDGTVRQGSSLGLRGNGWSLSSISDAATLIGGAVATPPAAFLAYSESQGNGRTEFDPRSTRAIANTGMSVVVVDTAHRVYTLTFSTSQRPIAGARADLNGAWVLELLGDSPSLPDLGLGGQLGSFEQAYIDAATG